MPRRSAGRRTYAPEVADKISGLLAKRDQPCARDDGCGGILVGQRITRAPGGGYMHVEHAAGQDDR